MQLYNDEHTKNAITDDEQASNPEWDCYFDRNKNKWITYSSLPGECYSKQARVIGNISRGFFNKNSIDKYMSWKNPTDSLVGISMTLTALLTSKNSNNLNAYNYILTLVPSEYNDSDIDNMLKKYYNLWKLNNDINVYENEV